MPYSLNLTTRVTQLASDLERALNTPGGELASAALVLARIEYPALEPGIYIERLDAMGRRAGDRLGGLGHTTSEAIQALNEYLYDEEGFTGNREQYEDPRNSFLNEVLDRRTGIPISLAVVYLEVARRAGLNVSGVNFPGHFLLRANAGLAGEDDLIIDPFHGGALLSEFDCRQLLRSHVGDEAAFDGSLLSPATRHDIVVRMLVNLKRLYVRMRSFPQARVVSTLLLTANPSAIDELRDRGLLAYHLEDFSSALRDLEEYLRLTPHGGDEPLDDDETDADEHAEDDEPARLLDHVKALRRRVAGFN
ncbi:MAG TPA: transglutaminase-like domain-containing protein [Vicinamibacterales bacterium]|nr:transglutaminase-like domain-containing protein [Vicinamibacterales bacterium]